VLEGVQYICHYNNMSITWISSCNPVIAVNGSQNSELKLTLNLVKHLVMVWNWTM